MKLADGKAVAELVAVVGPLARLVNLARREVPVGENPERREVEPRRERFLRPVDDRLDEVLGTDAGDREIVLLQATD